MKLRIWQQWSSNNSSNFTVVGEFKTTADAKRAAEEVRHILSSIEAWYVNNPEEGERLWNSDFDMRPPASPPEEALARQYNVLWPYALEVGYGFKVLAFEKLVIIDHERRPDNGPEPLDKLLERLGGRVFADVDVYGDPQSEMWASFSFVAPDDAVAEEIVRTHATFPMHREGRKIVCEEWEDIRYLDFAEWLMSLRQKGCEDFDFEFKPIPDSTLVGLFQSPEDAVEAAATLSEILVTIDDWYNNLSESARAREWEKINDPSSPLTPPELQFKEKYNLVWNRRINWFREPPLFFFPEHVVKAFDRFVFVMNRRRANWQSPSPFDQIIERLGGMAAVNGTKKDNEEVVTRVTVDISCTATDSQRAKEIASRLPQIISFFFEGTVQVHGDQISIQRWHTANNIDLRLPELVRSLRMEGCTDFVYSLNEVTEV